MAQTSLVSLETFCSSEHVLYLPKLFPESCLPGSFEGVKGSWVCAEFRGDVSAKNVHLPFDFSPLPGSWGGMSPWRLADWKQVPGLEFSGGDEQRGRTTVRAVAGHGPKASSTLLASDLLRQAPSPVRLPVLYVCMYVCVCVCMCMFVCLHACMHVFFLSSVLQACC